MTLPPLDSVARLSGRRSAWTAPARKPTIPSAEKAYGRARRAMELLSKHGFRFKINATVTRHNYPEIDDLYAIANLYGGTAAHPPTPHRPRRLRPTHAQNRGLYEWLLNHRDVLTGDRSSICRLMVSPWTD